MALLASSTFVPIDTKAEALRLLASASRKGKVISRYLAGLVLVSALAFASAVPAEQPEMTRVDVDETTSPAILCDGFQVDLHDTGHVILRTFFDKNGDLMR